CDDHRVLSAEIKSNNRSTPGSRCRFATVSMSRCPRRFCPRRCSISVCAVRARWRSLLFTTTMSEVEHDDLLQLQPATVIRVHHEHGFTHNPILLKRHCLLSGAD